MESVKIGGKGCGTAKVAMNERGRWPCPWRVFRCEPGGDHPSRLLLKLFHRHCSLPFVRDRRHRWSGAWWPVSRDWMDLNNIEVFANSCRPKAKARLRLSVNRPRRRDERVTRSSSLLAG